MSTSTAWSLNVEREFFTLRFVLLVIGLVLIDLLLAQLPVSSDMSSDDSKPAKLYMLVID